MQQKKSRRNMIMEREKNQRKAGIEGDTPSLPFDIIYSVLSRLPVKSLLRFRCICKSWRLVISEPQFIKTHLNQSIKSDRQRLFCSASTRGCFVSICDNSFEKLYFPLKKPGFHNILCSCNGLVLLGDIGYKICVLWNPSTRANKTLSCPFYFSLCRLCYDSSIDDYKVVLITRPPGGEFIYVVFSFNRKSWTKARKFPYFPVDYETGVNVNGLLHFTVLTSPGSDRRRYRIVYFDSVNEEFKEVPPPICISKRDRFGLMVVKGCLGLYCTAYIKYVGEQADIWVMKEHGDINSWTKLMVIPYLNCWWKKLVCVTDKGEEAVMVINDGKNIAFYNPREKKYRLLPIILRPIPRMSNSKSVVSFVDSLVLPTTVD